MSSLAAARVVVIGLEAVVVGVIAHPYRGNRQVEGHLRKLR